MCDTNPMFAPSLVYKQYLIAFKNNLNPSKLALVITAAMLANGMLLQKINAREVDLDTLCQKFPLNSRCEGYTSPAPAENATVAAAQDSQVMKLRLKTSGPDNEWLRMEMNGNTVKLVHTTRSKRGISGLFNGVLGAVSPIPLPNINSHRWNDHPTTRVVFEPNGCSLVQRLKHLENAAPQISQTSGSLGCAITGTDTVKLSEGMDIRSGRFTIEYQEGELLRSITFRLPTEES